MEDGSSLQKCLDKAMDYCLYYFMESNSNDIDEWIDCNENSAIGIKFNSIKSSYKKGMELYKKHSGTPNTSISNPMLFDFYKNEKTEFELVCFLAFCALKSIIQKQPYLKITNEYLLARMAGQARKGSYPPVYLHKFNNRYQLDKIKNELQLNWGLKLYSAKNMRGYYVSFSVDLETLIEKAELKKKGFRLQELKNQKKEIADKVKREIVYRKRQVEGEKIIKAVVNNEPF